MDALALELGARFQAASQKSGWHANRLFAIIKAFLILVDEIPAIPTLMFADPRQMGGAGKYPGQETTARFGWFHGALFAEIDARMRTREFRPDIHRKVAAGLAAGIAQSLIFRWRVSGGAIEMLGEAARAYPLILISLTGLYESSEPLWPFRCAPHSHSIVAGTCKRLTPLIFS
jgi:hypothetical protein